VVLFTSNSAFSQSDKTVAKFLNGNVEFIKGQENKLLASYNKTLNSKSKIKKLSIKKSGDTYYISGRTEDMTISIAQELVKSGGNYYKINAATCTCTSTCTTPGECEAYMTDKGCGCTSCEKDCTKTSSINNDL